MQQMSTRKSGSSKIVPFLSLEQNYFLVEVMCMIYHLRTIKMVHSNSTFCSNHSTVSIFLGVSQRLCPQRTSRVTMHRLACRTMPGQGCELQERVQ